MAAAAAAAASAATGFLVPSSPCGRGKLGVFGVPRLVFGAGERSSARWSCCSGVPGAERSPAVKSVAPHYIGQGCKLIGCGSAVPKLMVSNNDLASIIETSDEWISTRTGIHNRRVLSGEESLTALAVEASSKALQMAQIEPDDVDLILMCTSTPDDLFGCGPQIQRALGCRNHPWSIDIRAACSGFIAGILSAAGHIRGLGYRNVLVVGADALSRYVDWTDRGSCILFGDAAGAAVVQACDGKEDSLLGFDTNSDGDGQRHLSAPIKDHSKQESKLGTNGAVGFPPTLSSNSCIQMNGREVFRFAVSCVPASVEKSLEKAGLASSDLDWLLLHQANQRIIDSVASRLQIAPENVLSNLANYGNTSAASIPLALDEAVRGGKIKPGDTIAIAGFGAGLSWGSAIVRWGSAT